MRDDIVDRLTTMFWATKDAGDVQARNTIADAIEEIERLRVEAYPRDDVKHQNLAVNDTVRPDIVSRLRDHTYPMQVWDKDEAADKIERLREQVQDLRMYAEQDACEIERLRALTDSHVDHMVHNKITPSAAMNEDIVTRLQDECESLKVDVQVLRDAVEEIKRLRTERAEEIAGARSVDRRNHIGWETLRQFPTLTESLAEVERLRALNDLLGNALEQMSCQNCDDRKCMDCVSRSHHDACVEDCMECTSHERVHSPFVNRHIQRAAALEAWRAGLR